MKRSKYNILVLKAAEALAESPILHGNEILKSYNGQVAALGIAIAMSGLLPTLAIYYQGYDANDRQTAHRREVLDIVVKMVMGGTGKTGKDLFQKVLELNKNQNLVELSELQTNIIDSSVALKQVIRTYTLVDKILERK